MSMYSKSIYATYANFWCTIVLRRTVKLRSSREATLQEKRRQRTYLKSSVLSGLNFLCEMMVHPAGVTQVSYLHLQVRAHLATRVRLQSYVRKSRMAKFIKPKDNRKMNTTEFDW